MQRSVENTKHEHTSVTHAVQVCESGTERDAQIQPKKLTTHERRALKLKRELQTFIYYLTPCNRYCNAQSALYCMTGHYKPFKH